MNIAITGDGDDATVERNRDALGFPIVFPSRQVRWVSVGLYVLWAEEETTTPSVSFKRKWYNDTNLYFSKRDS